MTRVMWASGVRRFPLFLHALWLAAVIAAGGCGSTSTNFVGPSGSKCEISVTNDTAELPAAGGSGKVTIATSRDCTWSASADASWINVSATSGQGAATVNYTVQPNPNGNARRGRLVVAQQAVDVAQAAAPCLFELSPSTLNVDHSDRQVSVTVTVPTGCAWTVRSDVPWIGNAVPAQGNGGGAIRLTVGANSGAARTGTVAIGNATLRVSQSAAPVLPGTPPPEPVPGTQPAPTPQPTPTPGPSPTPGPQPTPGPSCSYGVSPGTASVNAGAEQLTVDVSTQAACSWTANSNASWIVVESGATGVGAGSVRVTVAANPGGARTGTLTVAGRTVTIDQAAKPAPVCTYTLAPTGRDVGRSAEEFTVGVNTASACTWTVSSDAPWITVVGAPTGSGAGTFRLAVAANTGGPRTGTVRVANEIFTVNQANGACNYAIRPTSYDAGRGPDDISVNVTAENGCTWTTTTNAPWVTVASGSSGTGNGIVRLLIPANNGPARSALVTIAGNPFTLRQEAGCTPTIKPDFYDAGRGPDNIRIAVSAEPGCTWTAASSVDWVSVAEGASGSGNGLVRLVVQPNNGAPRAVTLSIAGQPFELRQEGQ